MVSVPVSSVSGRSLASPTCFSVVAREACDVSSVPGRFSKSPGDLIEIEHKDGRHSTLIGHHQDGAFRARIETDKRTLHIDMGGPVSARLLAAVLDVLTPGGYPRLWRVSAAGSVAGRPGEALAFKA